MNGGLDVYRGRAAVPLRRKLAEVETTTVVAGAKITAHRQVAEHAIAQETRLRELLRAVEQHNPDAAPEVAVSVRIATAGIIAAQLEFGAEL